MVNTARAQFTIVLRSMRAVRAHVQQSDIAEMVAIGWQGEGIVFCAPN
ncbi:MAG: hypothetical protein IPM02_24115 [Betaproteobacteria bacterium]|nr:hypothetical protein [Betaproteobacteria bacterium]